ncbi:MAG: MbtF [Desulfovibrio sp.]|nr:MbtF [Desulfovibrio sp.]
MQSDAFGSVCRCLVFVLFPTLLMTACASRDSADEFQAGMSVTVTLRDEHRCSRISPEIQVSAAPSGTAYYDVRLVEESVGEAQEVFLGGGSWEHDGSGVIPEGVLTRHYRGPCPQPGTTGRYAFVVSAMSRESMQPLAVRLYRFVQE